jgi:hypothetical protein
MRGQQSLFEEKGPKDNAALKIGDFPVGPNLGQRGTAHRVGPCD